MSLNSVITVQPIHADESLTCYLLRLATSESVCGIAGLLSHMKFGTSNAALNKNVSRLASFTRQPESVLRASRICIDAAHPTLKEKFARFSSHTFCPHCVREKGYFKRDWRHGLVTACAEHGCELVDQCPSCNSPIKSSRANLHFCDCGQELASIPTSPAAPHALWVSSAIGNSCVDTRNGPNFGNTQSQQWLDFDELIFLMGSYAVDANNIVAKPRRTSKFESVEEAKQFVENACKVFRDFPSTFEDDIKTRLLNGDKSKTGLANRLGYWFREFRRLTQNGFPELRAAFARSVIANFDGHDSKNPWIYEYGTQRHLSITEAAKQLGVKSSRLRAMLVNMSDVVSPKDNTFNTVPSEVVEKLQAHLASALNQVEVLERTGITEAVLRQFSDIGLIPKRKRAEWDLNVYKNFDVADVQATEDLLFDSCACSELGDHGLVAINDINNRLSTNKSVVRELFEKIALGELKPVNKDRPSKLVQVVFSKADVTAIIGNSHEASKVTVEQLSRMTGWKSESIRYWVSQGFLDAEEGQLRGQTTYWVSIPVLHKFMSKYRVVSELALQLGTNPKALTEKLAKLGIDVVGAKFDESSNTHRGGLVEQVQIFNVNLFQVQADLFKRGASPSDIKNLNRIGIAKGEFDLPDSIDETNEEIRNLFEGP